LLFTAGITHCWLEKHGGKAELTQGSIGEEFEKNYGVF